MVLISVLSRSVATGEREAVLETKGKFVMSVAYRTLNPRFEAFHCIPNAVLLAHPFLLSSDGRTIACGGMDGVINTFDVPSATLKGKIQGFVALHTFCLCPTLLRQWQVTPCQSGPYHL